MDNLKTGEHMIPLSGELPRLNEGFPSGSWALLPPPLLRFPTICCLNANWTDNRCHERHEDSKFHSVPGLACLIACRPRKGTWGSCRSSTRRAGPWSRVGPGVGMGTAVWNPRGLHFLLHQPRKIANSCHCPPPGGPLRSEGKERAGPLSPRPSTSLSCPDHCAGYLDGSPSG